jgi:phosphoglycerate dehydrogenase-like enzyme
VGRPLVLFWAEQHRTPLLDANLREFCDTALVADCSRADRSRAVALVASSTGVAEPIGDAGLGELPALVVLASRGAGANCFDIAAATRRGLPVLHNPGVASDAVVEYVLGTLPLVYRQFVAENMALRAGRELRGVRPQLAGKTVAILGLGAIGRLVAERARAAYGVRITTWHPRHRPDIPDGVSVVGALDELLSTCDALVVTVPLTAETTGLIGARELALMKPSAVLVNVSRGGVVDEAALTRQLNDGRLAGAAVDVFDLEPVRPDYPLLALPIVFATPHCAGIATESRERLDRATADGVLSALAGLRPPRIVNDVWPPHGALPRDFRYPVPEPA